MNQPDGNKKAVPEGTAKFGGGNVTQRGAKSSLTL